MSFGPPPKFTRFTAVEARVFIVVVLTIACLIALPALWALHRCTP